MIWCDPLGRQLHSYEWKRGDVVIADAIAMTYTLVDEDVADRITVTAKYTDTDNVEQSATSNPVGPVVSPNAATGNPQNQRFGSGWLDVDCGSGRHCGCGWRRVDERDCVFIYMVPRR